MHGAGVFLLPGLDAERETVLPWWQGTGGKVCESTRRTVRLVEINHHFPRRIRWRHVKVTTRTVGFLSGGFVGNHHEEVGLALFEYWIDSIDPAAKVKRQRTR